MTTFNSPKLLLLLLPSCLLISGCSTAIKPNTQNVSSTPIKEAAIVTNAGSVNTDNAINGASGVDHSGGYSGYAFDPNGVELVDAGEDTHQYQEPRVSGPAEALATDSKHYAASYGVDHTEAMRQMLIQHDTQEQTEALQAEFGDKIVGMGFIKDPEYGYLVTLSGTGAPPPDRIMYRPADKLKGEREIIPEKDELTRPEDLRLTQAEVDMAAKLIESPTRFLVRFEMSPTGKNLTESEKQIMYERSSKLHERIPMITGSSYRSDKGVYLLYVHEEDAKAAGLTEDKLKQIGEEVMKMPVRIQWEQGYATEGIGTVTVNVNE